MSSTYDMGFGESDIESLGSDTNENPPVPKDYWFGRKYFECVMAQGLLHHSALHESMPNVDVTFHSSLLPAKKHTLTVSSVKAGTVDSRIAVQGDFEEVECSKAWFLLSCL